VIRDEPAATGASRRAPERAPAQLPVDNAAFAGRTDPLKALDDLLADRPATAALICALSGTAGVGKTTLAVHWAHRVRDRFPDGQLYVNLRGFDPDGTGVDRARRCAGSSTRSGCPPTVPDRLAARGRLYRSVLGGAGCSCCSTTRATPSRCGRCCPAGRLPGAGDQPRTAGQPRRRRGAQPVPLDLLTPARRATCSRAGGRGADGGRPAAVDTIVGRCARCRWRLPIAAPGRDEGLTLRALADELGGDPTWTPSTPGRVTRMRAVFSWSYRRLSPGRARLFRLLGLHPGPDISEPAAASGAGAGAGRVGPQLLELVDANLLGEPRPVDSPATTCCARTRRNWRTTTRPRPTGGPPPGGSSTITCTPRTRRRS
jgi:hypothetical protein